MNFDKNDDQDVHEEPIEESEDLVHEEESAESALESKLEEAELKYKRALADYQNLEKRNREERGEWVRSANREMLLRILPVLDTLMLAKEHDDNPTLAVSAGQFLDVLKAEGVEKIETVGKTFDPHLMECVEKIDDSDMVIEEVRAGYTLYDKLLRPSQVKVGKKKGK